MKNLYEPLPETVEVSGSSYRITTDFRDWLRFSAMLEDDEFPGIDKIATMLEYYIDTPTGDIQEAINALLYFYSGYHGDDDPEEDTEESRYTKSRNTRVLGFAEDSAMIFSAFYQAYGIDLFSMPDMHWHKFKALLDGIPEDTKLSRVIEIRTKDLKDVPKDSRKRYQKLKSLFSLDKNAKQKRPKTKEEADREFIERMMR